MPHLVATIRKTPTQSVAQQLELAFKALAPAWLAHYGKMNLAAAMTATSDWRSMARAVREAAAPIDLTAARAVCPLIQQPSERPEEVYHGLGHMEVLLAAVKRLAGPDLVRDRCSRPAGTGGLSPGARPGQDARHDRRPTHPHTRRDRRADAGMRVIV